MTLLLKNSNITLNQPLHNHYSTVNLPLTVAIQLLNGKPTDNQPLPIRCLTNALIPAAMPAAIPAVKHMHNHST